MAGLVIVIVFVVMIGFPGFYIITRKMFPRSSKAKSAWLCGVLTAALAGLLVYLLTTAPTV